jgi:hypothetical protein
VESDPTFKIVTEGDSDTNSMVPIIGGAGEQRPFVIQHPLARRPYILPQHDIRRVVPRHTLLSLRRASCPAQNSWRRACALLLHRHRRWRLLLHEEEAARLHRRTRPSAERRGPVCTREQALKSKAASPLAKVRHETYMRSDESEICCIVFFLLRTAKPKVVILVYKVCPLRCRTHPCTE